VLRIEGFLPCVHNIWAHSLCLFLFSLVEDAGCPSNNN
jgi:hypothetical protein